MRQLSKQEAIQLGQSEWWKDTNQLSIATFQVTQDALCCPIKVYKSALNAVLNRVVFTSELSKPELLINEMNKDKKPPTFEEIISMLPANKTAFIKFN